MASSPAKDPRIDPQMLKAAAKLGIDSAVPASPLSNPNIDIRLEDLIQDIHNSEKVQESFHNLIVDHETGHGVLYSLEHVRNPNDGFQIDLHIHRPADQKNGTLLPAVVIIHGGAMVMFHAYGVLYRRWAHDLARRGLVAINVSYRNAVSSDGMKHNPFPTGLNDCVAAIHWISENRTRLGISKLVLQGESGGANLAIATTMKLLRDGHGSIIDGLYIISPYVSGSYDKPDEWKTSHGLASLVECDGYLLNCMTMSMFAKVYDPAKRNEHNPLAWPWFASRADFAGFPRTVLTVDELDPLRDEGLAVARKMAEAGVCVDSRVNAGMMHSAALWQGELSDLNEACLGDVKSFADMCTLVGQS